MKFVICSILLLLVLASTIDAKKSGSKFVNKNKKKQQPVINDLAAQAQALIDKNASPLNVVDTPKEESKAAPASDKQQLVQDLEEEKTQKLDNIKIQAKDVLTFDGDLQNIQFTGEQLLKMMKFNDKFMEICGENLEKCDFQSESSDDDQAVEKSKKKKSSFLQVPEISKEQVRLNAIENVLKIKQQLSKNTISFLQMNNDNQKIVNSNKQPMTRRQFKAMKKRKAMRAQLKAQAAKLPPKHFVGHYQKPQKTAGQIEDDMKFAQFDNHIPKGEQKMAMRQAKKQKSQGHLINNPKVMQRFQKEYMKQQNIMPRFEQVTAFPKQHVIMEDIVLQNPRFSKKSHVSKEMMKHEEKIKQNLPSIKKTLQNGGFRDEADKIHYFLGDNAMRFKQIDKHEIPLRAKLLANHDVLIQAEKEEGLYTYADEIKEEAKLERELRVDY